jgi:hypothetical protein
MSHQSVRLLLEDVAKSLADNICFSFGRESEFNNLKTKENRYIWLLPMTANFPISDTTRTKTWNIALLFMDVDRFDASNKETNIIHDELDVVVDKFIHRLDDWSQTQQDTVGAITLSGVRQSPFFKDQAGVVSGWRVDFTMQVPDLFEYCTEDNIRIYSGTY